MSEQKKNIIIGTAGHVDHGKTCLVKALTGTDTDRLAEEKKRGITIELGFARLDFGDGRQAAMIDVPGHERFIKNMLAGAGGVDYAMLVIAADEGVMPQTREHLGILTLLGIRRGLVVITKSDLVDGEWLEAVREEAAELVAGTFLAEGPMLTVSARTGQGIEELKACLSKELEGLEPRPAQGPFRLPIDRVFTMEGFGTVVTGTLLQGRALEGQEAMVYPQGLPVRLRGLQVHGQPVTEALAGQRVAINLAGVRKDELKRGQVLAAAGFLTASLMLDVRLRVLADAQRMIESGSRLHVHLGSQEALGKAVLLDREVLAPGESGYAQLRFEEPVAVKRGDPFVVRFFSPVETIGGGEVLEPLPAKHKAGDKQALAGLAVKESGDELERFYQHCLEGGWRLTSREETAARLDLRPERVERLAGQLLREGRLFGLAPGLWLSRPAFDSLSLEMERLMEEYHAAEPLSPGLSREVARQKLLGRLSASRSAAKWDKAAADALLTLLAEQGKLRLDGQGSAQILALRDFRPAYSAGQRALREKLLMEYQEAGLEAPWLDEVYQRHGARPKEKEACRQVLEALLNEGLLIRIDGQMLVSRAAYEAAARAAAAAFQAKSELSLADFRDMWATSRKYALAILEAWDARKITKKVNDVRILIGSLE